MRIALALGLCLIAVTATAAPRAKSDRPKPSLPQRTKVCAKATGRDSTKMS